MKKKIFVSLIFLALLALAGVYVMTANAQANDRAPDPTQTGTAPTVPRSPTAKPGTSCRVSTGIEGGTVNLRACEGVSCGRVLDILTEGESLTIVTAGLWMNVTTKSGVTGWLNKKYCVVKP